MTRESATTKRPPLKGLRVIDFSCSLAGPFAAMMLADLGAEAIRVDDTSHVDPARAIPPFVEGESHVYLAANRNKESVALDLESEAGRKLARALVGEADVVLESFASGEAARLGLDHRSLSRINPGLVHCSISGFGRSGPLRDRSAVDIVVQALTGAMSITGEKGRPPARMGLPLAEEITSLFAAIAVLAAVERRDRTGAGAHVDISMFDAGLSMLSYMANIFFATGDSPDAQGSSHPTIYPYNAFETADGYIVIAPFTQAFWRKFCQVIGREDLPLDPRFATFKERLENRKALAEILDAIMLTKPSQVWLEALDRGDVPNGPVNSVAAALSAAQTHARGMIASFDHPADGTVKTLGNPFHLRYADGGIFEPVYSAPPLPGQHGRSILATLLGKAEAEIGVLQAEGVLGVAEVASATRIFPHPPARPVPSGAVELPPLDGVRVLDLTRMLAGPYGTMILADLGAEVIKVEEPRIGDPTRRNIPFAGEESTYFMAVNRGKKSITLDLKTPEGHDAVIDLIKTCDVVFENYRPGVMERLGLGYRDLVKIKPDIILCSISGYGQSGPLRDKISFDLVNQAMAGTMALTGEPDRPPVRVGLPAGDLSGGIFGAFGVLAALFNRRRTGLGCHIDLALNDLLLTLLGPVAQLHFATGETPGPIGSADRYVAPHGAFRARDGYIVLIAPDQATWIRLTAVIGRPELTRDLRFRDNAARLDNRAALHSLIGEAIAQDTIERWVAALNADDVPCAEIKSVGAALESEQAAARGIVFEYDHPTVGRTRTVGTPFFVDGRPWRSILPSPLLGEHNAELLNGEAGTRKTVAARAEGSRRGTERGQ